MKPKLEIRLSWLIIAAVLWFLIFSLAGKACAGGLLDPEWLNDWDKTDRLLLAGYTLVWFIDWGQTRDIAKRPDEYEEQTAEYLIGKHPSTQTVDASLIGIYILNLFVANTLEGGWRKGYLTLFMLGHGYEANHNRSIGLRINFTF